LGKIEILGGSDGIDVINRLFQVPFQDMSSTSFSVNIQAILRAKELYQILPKTFQHSDFTPEVIENVKEAAENIVNAINSIRPIINTIEDIIEKFQYDVGFDDILSDDNSNGKYAHEGIMECSSGLKMTRDNLTQLIHNISNHLQTLNNKKEDKEDKEDKNDDD
jgi:hypothetical protein